MRLRVRHRACAARSRGLALPEAIRVRKVLSAFLHSPPEGRTSLHRPPRVAEPMEARKIEWAAKSVAIILFFYIFFFMFLFLFLVGSWRWGGLHLRHGERNGTTELSQQQPKLLTPLCQGPAEEIAGLFLLLFLICSCCAFSHADFPTSDKIINPMTKRRKISKFHRLLWAKVPRSPHFYLVSRFQAASQNRQNSIVCPEPVVFFFFLLSLCRNIKSFLL